MSVVMRQSNMAGNVRGIIYRALLRAELTTDELIVRASIVGSLGWDLVRVPLERITEVRQIAFLVFFGLKISYRDQIGAVRTMKWYTYRYKRWTHAFKQVGIAVTPHRDLFDWF